MGRTNDERGSHPTTKRTSGRKSTWRDRGEGTRGHRCTRNAAPAAVMIGSVRATRRLQITQHNDEDHALGNLHCLVARMPPAHSELALDIHNGRSPAAFTHTCNVSDTGSRKGRTPRRGGGAAPRAVASRPSTELPACTQDHRPSVPPTAKAENAAARRAEAPRAAEG